MIRKKYHTEEEPYSYMDSTEDEMEESTEEGDDLDYGSENWADHND